MSGFRRIVVDGVLYWWRVMGGTVVVRTEDGRQLFAAGYDELFGPPDMELGPQPVSPREVAERIRQERHP